MIFAIYCVAPPNCLLPFHFHPKPSLALPLKLSSCYPVIFEEDFPVHQIVVYCITL